MARYVVGIGEWVHGYYSQQSAMPITNLKQAKCRLKFFDVDDEKPVIYKLVEVKPKKKESK